MQTSSLCREQTRTCSWLPDEYAPAAARHTVRAVLDAWRVDEESVQDAALVMTEIVTNAVRHVRPALWDGGFVHARVRLSGPVLSAEVCDPDPRLPEPCRALETDEGLRGLAVVRACVRDCGWHRTPVHGGKAVWWTQSVTVGV